ncbi:MAG TPA: galactosyltransferase-related protein [Chitinophaga sp.]|uniref:galactosyltransferase-related protein n=1 Tax=Chitinophaga sp. TaxID=1869181 RepID=UPI002BF2E5FE|nr:galactosyltransferase-related protein [Chitinophaga sp.]HVI45569.1 galactosyltransferase-related protein [Chitinophaga sp.]
MTEHQVFPADDIIFLSAQSDDYYYLWQLQLQLLNFSGHGIQQERIHVLFSFDPVNGLNEAVRQFMLDNSDKAAFFTYPDKRQRRAYGSGIRPHIIAQHLDAYPDMQRRPLFYHDCDIIFSRLPDFNALLHDEVWYVSDTRSYLGIGYIQQFGENTLREMCHVIGMDEEMVRQHDQHTGGAQYLVKNTRADFWRKVEEDAETLYTFLDERKYTCTAPDGKSSPIQSWCSDMWALLWNTWYAGYKVRIAPDLDFSWAYDNISKWQAKNIYHNTGEKADSLHFNKSRYVDTNPFFKDLSRIDTSTCSIHFVDIIEKFRNAYYKEVPDVTFAILLKADSPERLQNAHAVIKHIRKYFRTNMKLMEVGLEATFSDAALSAADYSFVYDPGDFLHMTRYHNRLIREADTPMVCLLDADVLIDPSQLYDAIVQVRYHKADMCYPYDGTFIDIDRACSGAYYEDNDFSGIVQQQEVFRTRMKNSVGGAVLVDKEIYCKAGLENEHIVGWGPDDLERYYRMKILGHRITRIAGPLYHLYHPVTVSSVPRDAVTSWQNRKVLLDICNSTRSALSAQVEQWPWSALISTRL